MRMRIAIVLPFLFSAISSTAQTDKYLTDLSALRSILQKTPSYNEQIKGEKLIAYDSLYQYLVSDTVNNPGSYHYFYNLSQLIFPLRDNHLGFYQVPDYDRFKTQATIDSFVASRDFLEYPEYKINIDSLKTVLATRATDSIEGIYHYDKFYSVGLFKSGYKEYTGVIVASNVNMWRRGQIAIRLYENAPNLYKAMYGHPSNKYFILQTNEKYRNQSLVNSYFYGSYSQSIYTKQLKQINYVNLSRNAPKFELKNINADVQYLLIRTFQADNITMQRSHQFYDSVKNLLTAPNLVLDLRNNEGGAGKETSNYFALLKKYTRTGNVYVLINNNTLSQAEIFILKLKDQFKNIILLGQTTKGMLAYGSNYGRRLILPSGKFEIYPTDMGGSTKLLKYEDNGIPPDIFLNENSDWIEQAVELIQKK
ncbi:MAG: S41 family peptidase [Bacteroidota bacterium]